MKRLNFLLLLILTSLSCNATDTCPALDRGNTKIVFSPPQISSVTTEEQDRKSVDPKRSKNIIEAVLSFESKKLDRYTTVSSIDGISVGLLQWNSGSNSLLDIFLANTPNEILDLSDETIRGDLHELKSNKYACAKNDEKLLDEIGCKNNIRIIKAWQINDGKPSGKSALRADVVVAWENWLSKPEIKLIQDSLVQKKIKLAESYARQWFADTNRNEPPPTWMSAFFFDLIVFKGGRDGLWIPHVKEFRHAYPKLSDILNYLDYWLALCNQQAKGRLLNLEDAQKSLSIWKESFNSNPDLFSEDQIDFLVLSILAAQHSIGNSGKKGMEGIFQADQIARGGTIAMHIGQVHNTLYSCKKSPRSSALLCQ